MVRIFLFYMAFLIISTGCKDKYEGKKNKAIEKLTKKYEQKAKEKSRAREKKRLFGHVDRSIKYSAVGGIAGKSENEYREAALNANEKPYLYFYRKENKVNVFIKEWKRGVTQERSSCIKYAEQWEPQCYIDNNGNWQGCSLTVCADYLIYKINTSVTVHEGLD